MQTKASSLGLRVSFLTSLLALKDGFGLDCFLLLGIDCFLLLMVVGARNKLGSTLPTLVLTSLKHNP
jgi:hypothetical protein